MGNDREGPIGPPAFVFFLLLTLRLGIGKCLPRVPAASVQCGLEAALR